MVRWIVRFAQAFENAFAANPNGVAVLFQLVVGEFRRLGERAIEMRGDVGTIPGGGDFPSGPQSCPTRPPSR